MPCAHVTAAPTSLVSTRRATRLDFLLSPDWPSEIDLMGRGQSAARRARRTTEQCAGGGIAGERSAQCAGAGADRAAADRAVLLRRAAARQHQGDDTQR